MILKHFITFLFFLLSLSPLSADITRPMNFIDIVTLTKPGQLELSPQGTRAAFVAQQGCLEQNRNVNTLYFWDIQKNQQKPLYQADKIKNIRWVNENCFYFIAQQAEIYEIVSYSANGTTTFISSTEPIYSFALSPDGSVLYYTQTKSTPEEIVKKNQEEGYVYQWGIDNSLILFDHSFRHKEKEEIWSVHLDTKKRNLLISLPYNDWPNDLYGLIENIKVSPDGAYLAVHVNKLGRPEEGNPVFISDILLCDLVNSQCNEFFPSYKKSFCWISPKHLFFQTKDRVQGKVKYISWLYNVESSQLQKLNWLKIPGHLNHFFWNEQEKKLFCTSQQKIYRVCFDNKLFEEINLQGHLLSLDSHARFLGCLEESSNTSPDFFVYDLKNQQCVAKTDLNPQIKRLALGHIEKMEISTSDGLSVTGCLVHPLNEQPERRYPIIIATYDFSGKFITDGEWHSTFPAQVLAAEGYCVLLLNLPPGGMWIAGNSDMAQKKEGWDALALAERAVDILTTRGIGDPTKVGVYGWSHGTFIAYFLIAHSQKFHAASIGEGGDFNPSGFWMSGSLTWPQIYKNIFGGPPWGSTLQNYLGFSPFFQIDKITAPILMEFALGSGIGGMEMYVPLRCAGVPAEFVFYQGEEHNFVKPKARIASMKRKVDWFNFWLLGKQDPDPDKKMQYERWSQMRK